jgi:hypothetical protein
MCRLILLLSPISLLACYSAYAQGSAQPSAPPTAQPPPPAYQGGRETTSGWVTRPLAELAQLAGGFRFFVGPACVGSMGCVTAKADSRV